jgi:hypothetical protein
MKICDLCKKEVDSLEKVVLHTGDLDMYFKDICWECEDKLWKNKWNGSGIKTIGTYSQ